MLLFWKASCRMSESKGCWRSTIILGQDYMAIVNHIAIYKWFFVDRHYSTPLFLLLSSHHFSCIRYNYYFKFKRLDFRFNFTHEFVLIYRLSRWHSRHEKKRYNEPIELLVFWHNRVYINIKIEETDDNTVCKRRKKKQTRILIWPLW